MTFQSQVWLWEQVQSETHCASVLVPQAWRAGTAVIRAVLTTLHGARSWEKQDRPRITEQRTLYHLGRTAIPKSFQVKHRPCGDSRYLGIKKHLLDCRADVPSPYRPSGPSTALSIGNQRDSVKLGGTHDMPAVQELGGVEGRCRSLCSSSCSSTRAHSDCSQPGHGPFLYKATFAYL